MPDATAAAITAPSAAARPGVVSALAECTKPRITRLVTITAGVGFAMAALGREPGAWTIADLLLRGGGCLAGTAMSAAGASALNQWMERGRDALMPRTAARPLPGGRVGPGAVLGAGLALCVTGVAVLWAMAGAGPAALSLATIVIYLLIYTPLKPVTPLSTLVGAVPGALPPLIGWTAASAEPGLGSLWGPGAAGGWVLFLIMFVWQIPHFLAIAWMYREDYARGGYRVLPVLDTDGGSTAVTILAWAALLIPVTAAPAVIGGAGAGGRASSAYLFAALVMGAVFLALSLRLAQSRARPEARTVFIASVVHLPVLLVALVADAAVSAFL